MPKTVENEEFKQPFLKYGSIATAYIIKHHSTQVSKGFGYIVYNDPNAAKKVFEEKIYIGENLLECMPYINRRDQ